MSRREDLYVGYLRMPKRHKGFVRGVAMGLFVVVVGVGGLIAAGQRDPGDGVWDMGEEREWEGYLQATPYPMLVSVEDGAARTRLLVGVGKVGVADWQIKDHGMMVRVRGYGLERDGRSMIEVDNHPLGIESTGKPIVIPLHEDMPTIGPTNADQIVIDFGGIGDMPVELTGEVLDSKCYLGAMKPGDGKGHKACATLCIEGGIPAMLFVEGDGGGRETYLLVDSEGKSARDVVLGYVGEPVVVNGKKGRIADLDVLAIESIERVMR